MTKEKLRPTITASMWAVLYAAYAVAAFAQTSVNKRPDTAAREV